MLAVELLTRVGLATCLGLLIGFERQWRSRMAGLQTMALVSLGSAMFMILSAFSFPQDGDHLRVAAQIVSGIGFLGAGVIMKQGSSVVGLNTAATLWATAAVGALAGAWMWREATAGALIIVVTNTVLQPLAARMDRTLAHTEHDTAPTDYVFEVECAAAAEARIRKAMIDALTQDGVRLTSLRSTSTSLPVEVRLRAELSAAKRQDAAMEQAVRTLSTEAVVSSVRWTTLNEAAVQWGSS